MKFLKEVVAAALLTLAQADAKKGFTRKDFEARVKAGKLDKKRLLKKAIPYNTYLRKLEDANQNGDADQDAAAEDGDADNYYYDQANEDYMEEEYGDNQYWDEEYARLEVTSNFKLQFNKCVTLETQNYNLLLDNLVNYAKAGTLTSIRNYVLFDVCEYDNCRSQNNNNNVYMVDLSTYIEAVVAYGPEEKERVCTGCQNYAYVCGKGDDANEDGQDNNNNGQRRIELDGYAIFDQSMCDQCDALNCWYDSEGDQEEDFESIEAWIAEIAECKQTERGWNNLALYGGWTCNSDGSGIEVGTFVDPYCRMYHNEIAFTSLMQDDDYQYYYQSQDVLPYMFSDVIHCRDMSEVQYIDSDTYQSYVQDYSNENDSNNAEQDGEDADNDINDVCSALFYGDFVPRSVGDCGTAEDLSEYEQYQNADEENRSYYQNQNMNGQGDGDEDGNEDGDQQDQYMYQYLQSQQMLYSSSGKDLSWVTYDISVAGILDGASTCNAVKTKFDGSKAADVYDSDGQEFWNGGLWRNGDTAFQTPAATLSALEIAWIILGASIATALFMHFTRNQVVKKLAKKEKEVYVADDKGKPLIIT